MAPMSPSPTWIRRLTTTTAKTKTTKVAKRQKRATDLTMNPSVMFLVAVLTTCLLCDQVTAVKGKSEDMLRDVAEISAEIDLRESWFSLLERLRRDNSDQEPQLMRRKRATEETGETTFDVELLEKRHELFANDEMELSRQKRNNEDEEDISKEALSRVKRNDDDVKLSNTEDVVRDESARGHSEKELSRQKRAEEETEELELSRQKRVKRAPEELELSRQKRTKRALEELELSRQKRTKRAPEELELSRQKRNEDEPELSREKRAEKETLDKEEQILSRQKRQETEDKELSRQKWTKRAPEELELSRQKRTKRAPEELELSRQKRTENEPELSREKRAEEQTLGKDEQILSRQKRQDTEDKELSRQKRTKRAPEELELSRQKRNEDEPELSRKKRAKDETIDKNEQILSRQKRQDTEDKELSRQKRTKRALEELELSRQKRNEDEQELSREKRAEEETLDKDEQILSQQKRQDTEDKELSRQKRNDGTKEDKELSRVKRVKRALSDPQDLQDSFLVSSADHLLNNPSEDEELSRQKREDASSEEKVLSRNKRRLLQFSEENLDDGVSHLSGEKAPSSKASSKESSTKHSGESQKDKKGEPPEHRNYHDDLLQRRMKVVKMENKRRKRGKTAEFDLDDEDGWDQELRIRRELAEKAIEYGIQQRKERMKNPELYGRELSILQRIKQDAEEILRRRKEEAMMGKKPTLKDTSLFRPESADGQGENGGEEEEGEGEGRKGKKKTAKAIRNLLNLSKGGKKGGTSAAKHSLPEQSPQENQDTSEPGGFNPYAADSVLRFETSPKRGKGRKGNRKKRKQGRLL